MAITSILHTDEHSSLEPVRYPDGSGFFRVLMAPHGPGATAFERLWNAARFTARHPWRALKAFFVPDFARHTMILLYMRSIDSYLSLRPGRGAPDRLAAGYRLCLDGNRVLVDFRQVALPSAEQRR